MFEDWELIEASFTAQYGIRLRAVNDMSYAEFCTLLAGLSPKTPLGQIVSIRSEEDEEILKLFTPVQHKIRNEWRIKMYEKSQKAVSEMTDEEKAEQVKKVQEIFKQAFS